MKKNFFGVMAAMMVLTLSCKKDKEPEAVDPLIDLTLICYSDNRAFLLVAEGVFFEIMCTNLVH